MQKTRETPTVSSEQKTWHGDSRSRCRRRSRSSSRSSSRCRLTDSCRVVVVLGALPCYHFLITLLRRAANLHKALTERQQRQRRPTRGMSNFFLSTRE